MDKMVVVVLTFIIYFVKLRDFWKEKDIVAFVLWLVFGIPLSTLIVCLIVIIICFIIGIISEWVGVNAKWIHSILNM